jgi:hypothetical protein
VPTGPCGHYTDVALGTADVVDIEAPARMLGEIVRNHTRKQNQVSAALTGLAAIKMNGRMKCIFKSASRIEVAAHDIGTRGRFSSPTNCKMCRTKSVRND